VSIALAAVCYVISFAFYKYCARPVKELTNKTLAEVTTGEERRESLGNAGREGWSGEAGGEEVALMESQRGLLKDNGTNIIEEEMVLEEEKLVGDYQKN
jgi:hypothetical protein